jgi:hypothetical protein
MEGIKITRAGGFSGCVELKNKVARVVLEPNVGGRVLSYQLNGVETLYQDPALDGVVWNGGSNILHPPGGRCDIGPEYGGLLRDELWFGPWTAEIIGPRSARMTSPTLDESGIQLVREFVLDSVSPHLRFKQTIRNRGRTTRSTFHWSRTFVVGDGIVLAPMPAHGRFPRGYAFGSSPGIIDFLPAPEPGIRIRDGIMEVVGSPSQAKFIFDVDPGWLGYVSPNGLFFLKKFPVYSDRPYGEIAANNASIWYSSVQNTTLWPNEKQVVEIEPIGPLETIAPGEDRSFTEDWWLEKFAFPADRRVDLGRIREVVTSFKP